MFKFLRFRILRFVYFRVLVVGRENRENLDLAKISCYTVTSFFGTDSKRVNPALDYRFSNFFIKKEDSEQRLFQL